MLLTVLTLVGLTFRVARFHEHFTITITKPAATDPPLVVLGPGQPIHVEGFIDPGEALYNRVEFIAIRLRKDPNIPSGTTNSTGSEDTSKQTVQASSNLHATLMVGGNAPPSVWYLDVGVRDIAGRTHSSGDGRGTRCNEVPIRVEEDPPSQ